jgi:hypothetical protein
VWLRFYEAQDNETNQIGASQKRRDYYETRREDSVDRG